VSQSTTARVGPLCVCGHPKSDHGSDWYDQTSECLHGMGIPGVNPVPCLCSMFRFRKVT
jgi:hypothetical protein